MQNKIKDQPVKAQNELAQHLIKKKKMHRKYTITKKISQQRTLQCYGEYENVAQPTETKDSIQCQKSDEQLYGV